MLVFVLFVMLISLLLGMGIGGVIANRFPCEKCQHRRR